VQQPQAHSRSSLPPTSRGTDSRGTEVPGVVSEEINHLEHSRRLLLEHPGGRKGLSEDEIVRDILALRDDMRGCKSEDQGAINEQIRSLTALLDQLRTGRNTETVDPDCPYFAHLQLKENGRHRDVFLGRATCLDHGLRIVDWRHAPVSRLFYQYDEGDEYCEEMAGRERDGLISARRTLHIEQGRLMRVGSSRESWVRGELGWRRMAKERMHLAGGEGAALRAGRGRLGAQAVHRADKHLPDIAALIDPDQFAAITAPKSGVVVLRGSAGSGKTTVALHRIAYLAFEGGRSFSSQRVMVVVWGRAMRDYVAHVLPALGVHGVQVTTWGEWSRAAVLRHFPMLPTTWASDTPAEALNVKLHAGVALALGRMRRGGPKTPERAIEDWARLITDRRALSEAMRGDISPRALERALEWNIQQTRNVLGWVEGDHEIDARLDTEDFALLLRAYQLRCGPLRRKGRRPMRHVHVVLDEVQDFSPVEVQVLLDTCDKHRCVTLAGDVRQHISRHAGFESWQSFLEVIGVESTALNTLEVSYRSTHPITRFALHVLDSDEEPPPRTTRDGPPVELFRFSEHGACVAFLAEELRRLQRAEPLANVALLTPNAALSKLYARGLEQANVLDVRRVVDQAFAFAPGIDVVEVEEVKGLEFDYVIIIESSARYWPDTPHHRRLMHVAATRAIHQLWLTSVARPTSILPPLDE